MSETDAKAEVVTSPSATATTTTTITATTTTTSTASTAATATTTTAKSSSRHTMPKVRFAPLRVPFERRMQTAAIMIWVASVPILPFLFLLGLFVPFFWPFAIAYMLFIIFDIAPENGGRAFDWAKRHWLWDYFAGYYPCSLHKEADLDPSKNYVFGYHPHGIISMGAFGNFATEATGFSDKFPGIKPRLLTLMSNFHLPVYRDYLLAMGVASVSRTSCERILNKGPGSSIVIVVGGATESLSARPGTNDLTLRKRLGFIKLAMCNGASLVPVFSFGENDLYEQFQNEKGSRVWKWQKSLQSVAGFTMPLFHGRGVFNYDFGLLPHRRAIHTIVGRPIETIKNKNPTEEELLAVQKLYINELQRVYDAYKDEYAKDRTKDLTIIE